MDPQMRGLVARIPPPIIYLQQQRSTIKLEFLKKEENTDNRSQKEMEKK